MRSYFSKTRFLRPPRKNMRREFAAYGAAVLLATGALASGLILGSTRPPVALICVFAVLISALVGGPIAGWLSLAITAGGLWFGGSHNADVHSTSFEPDLVLWCGYVALGIALIEVIRHMQGERRRLLEHDQRLRLAGRAARIWFWEWDLRRNTLRWTREREAVSSDEHEREIPLGTYVNRLVHPEDRERVMKNLLDSGTSGDRLELEFRVIDRDSSVHWLSAKGKIFTENGGNLMLGMASDITAQRQADEARSHFRAVLGSLIEGVCFMDNSGAIQYMNAAAELMLGYKSEQVSGKQLHDVVHNGGDAHRPDSCRLFQAMHSGSPCTLQEERLTPKSGEALIVECTTAPVTSDGTTLGAVMMFRDISERKRAEEALRASEKMAATGRMAATISHELRNPLDSVMQLLYLVKQSPKLGEVERQQLDLVDQELRRMTEVAQQTLAMHRQAPSMVPVNVTKLIDGVMLLYGKKIRSQKIEIEKRYEWEGEVPGFPAELRQVFTNLIINAVDAMPGGGKLWIHIRRHHEPKGQRQGVVVVLLDSGAGIPNSARKHLFKPFFTTKGEKGSGVGLWVSRGIVQRHGGTIRVHSTDRPTRSYTCFEVFLPDNVPQIQAPERAAREQAPAAPSSEQQHPQAA
jgi:PAS domain S-box-containing protein